MRPVQPQLHHVAARLGVVSVNTSRVPSGERDVALLPVGTLGQPRDGPGPVRRLDEEIRTRRPAAS